MKCVRQRQILYDLTHVELKKKKTNKNQKQIHRYLENTVVVTRGEGTVGREEKTGKRDQCMGTNGK